MTPEHKPMALAEGCAWAAGIALLNAWVFFPALFHVPRADQLFFLIETAGLERFGDIFARTYSYCRTRGIYPGDELLFRPLLYAFLSLQKAVFGYHFVAWQAAGLALHLGVLAGLARVLHLIRPGRWVPLAVAAFSVARLGSPLVVWHHLNSYLLFLVVLLGAWHELILFTRSGGRKRPRLVRAVLLTGVSCFLYEFGAVMALIQAVWLGAYIRLGPGRVREGWRAGDPFWFGLAAAVYAAASGIDFAAHGSGLTAAGALPDPALVAKGVGLSLLILAGGIMLPASLFVVTGEKMQLKAFYLSEAIRNPASLNAEMTINVMLVLLLAALGAASAVSWARGRRDSVAERADGREGGWMAGLALLAGAGYVAMLAVGRLSSRSIDYLTGDLYHYYFVELFAVVAFYASVAVWGARLRTDRRLLTALAVSVLLMSTGLNAALTRRQNVEQREFFAAWRPFFAAVDRFAAEHAAEPDFSFQVTATTRPRWIGFTAVENGQSVELEGLLSEFLFWPRTSVPRPKYFLAYTDGEGLASFARPEDAVTYYEQRVPSPPAAE